MLNVLLDRPNPTRYDVIQPGVVTTAKVQREMARDLRGTPVIVRWRSTLAREREPNGSSRSSGAFLPPPPLARRHPAAARIRDPPGVGPRQGGAGRPAGRVPRP